MTIPIADYDGAWKAALDTTVKLVEYRERLVELEADRNPFATVVLAMSGHATAKGGTRHGGAADGPELSHRSGRERRVSGRAADLRPTRQRRG